MNPLVAWARRRIARAMLPDDLLEVAATTVGHCERCGDASTLVLVHQVWPVCLDCYVDYRAGLVGIPEEQEMTLCDICAQEVPMGDTDQCDGCGIVSCCEHLECGLCPECVL